MPQSARPTPFRRALRAATEPRDWLLLAVPPVLLLGTFALPVETRESLWFVYREPTLLTAYTAHLVHFEMGHLLANLLGYLLLAGSGYALAALSGNRRLFGVTAATFVLVFPPALSALNLAVPRNAVGYGFSGMNMAFAGLLGLVLVAYGNQLDDRIRIHHAPGVFFVGVTVVSLVALPDSSVAFGVAAVSGMLAAGYGFAARHAWRAGSGRVVERSAGWFDAGVLGAVAFVGYQFVGYPSATVGSGIVNIYVHFLGFCLGFIVPYAASVTGVVERAEDRGFLVG